MRESGTPRTHPTVKQSISMNMKTIQHWEVRLGSMHVAILLGLITGSLACAFYFGYYTGQDAGYERAYAANVSQSVKLPIAVDKLPSQVPEEAVSEVYARLNDDVAKLPKMEEGIALVEPTIVKDAPVPNSAVASDTAPQAPQVNQPSDPQVAIGENKATLSDLASAQGERLVPDTNAKVSAAILTQPESKQVPITPPHATVQVKESSGVAKVTVKPEKQEKPEKTEKKMAGKPAAVTSKLSKGWYAQVAAPRLQTDAEAIAVKLVKSGFPVVIESANVKGQDYFRVLVGPEATRDRGERLVTQIKQDKSVSGDPFLRVVK